MPKNVPKKKIIFILIISMLLIFLSFGAESCKPNGNSTETETSQDMTQQLNGNWIVIMIDDVNLNSEDFINGLPVIKFDTVNKMISGNTGCNDFTGDATYTGNTIKIGDLIATKIACPDMTVEERLFEILNNQVITYDIDGDKLILTNDDIGGKLTLTLSTETNDISMVKTLVENFGKVLANVSLLSPPDKLESDMKKYYGPFLSEGLLLEWIKDPSQALGRLISSPWPDRIEVNDVKKITADKYEISGDVIEVTSIEVVEGGYANKFGIRLTVERINDRWLITKVMKETAPDNEESANQATIMEYFDKLLTSQVRSYQVVLFINENISKVTPANADFMLEKLEYVQKNDKQFYTDLLFEDDWQGKLNMIFHRDIESKDLEEIKDEQLKKIVSEIFDGGFKLVALEGSFYPYIDYEFLKKYSDNISPEYLDYVNIMATESNKIFSRDAALTISWDELALRLINCEEFLVSYPSDSIRKKAVGDLYMNYLVSYIIGQNNTPTYSYENKEIKPEVLESYSKLITDYPDNVTARLIRKYQEILSGTKNIVDDTALKQIEDIYRQAVHSFNLDTPTLLLEGIRNTYYQTSLIENGYIILVNGKYTVKNESDLEKNITIKLSDFTAFGDLDSDGINDAAAILIAEEQNGTMTYALTSNLNRYFYFKNIQDKVIGKSKNLEITNIEIKENKIYLNTILDKTEKTMIFVIKDGQLVET